MTPDTAIRAVYPFFIRYAIVQFEECIWRFPQNTICNDATNERCLKYDSSICFQIKLTGRILEERNQQLKRIVVSKE